MKTLKYGYKSARFLDFSTFNFIIFSIHVK